MESNGKRVTTDGKVADYATGEVNFDEPGTTKRNPEIGQTISIYDIMRGN